MTYPGSTSDVQIKAERGLLHLHVHATLLIKFLDGSRSAGMEWEST